jgi:hypothetical protein
MKTFIGGVWDRNKWQTERNEKNVPKGSGGKLNIGDEIAKFHTASTMGLPAGMAAAVSLEKKLGLYVAELKKKKMYNVPPKNKEPNYKGLVDRIEKRLIDVEIADYLTKARRIVASAKQYKAARDTAVTEVTEAVAEMVTSKEATEDGVGTVPKGWKPSNRKALSAAITDLYNTVDAGLYVSSAVTEKEYKDLLGLEATLNEVGYSEKLLMKLSTVVMGLPASI